MSKQITVARCQIKADSRLIADLFDKLRQYHINLKRIELTENPRDKNMFYLHLEANTFNYEAVQHHNLTEIVGQICKDSMYPCIVER